MLTLRVSRDGQPVTDLEPYLGAYGHLVALREGDLAYLHVHPGGEPSDGQTLPGPDIEFGAEVPSAGGYHLYLDFKHAGVVRTAQFTLDATSPDEFDHRAHQYDAYEQRRARDQRHDVRLLREPHRTQT